MSGKTCLCKDPREIHLENFGCTKGWRWNPKTEEWGPILDEYSPCLCNMDEGGKGTTYNRKTPPRLDGVTYD